MDLLKFTEADWLWMREAAAATPEPTWCGDLADDCTARWAGFTLRSEWMNNNIWWWAVYLDKADEQIASSNDAEVQPASGEEARTAALRAAQNFLGLPQ
jgi:hypothetical protein